MVPNTYRARMLVLAVVAMTGLGAPSWAVEQGCPEVSLVIPPESDGGTIYVTQRDDGRYERAGYLQTGTVLKVTKTVKIHTPEDPAGKRIPYSAFVSSTGLSGFVAEAATKTLHDLVNEFAGNRSNLLEDCRQIKAVVVPIDPTRDVPVYYRPVNEDTTSSTFTFSRSRFGLVVLRDDPPVTTEAPDGTVYFRIWFLQEQADPSRVLWKEGYLRKSMLDDPGQPGRYRFGLLPDRFPALNEDDSCLSDRGCTASIISNLMGVEPKHEITEKIQKLADDILSRKVCRLALELEGGIDSNWLLRVVGATMSATGSLTLPAGEQYGVRSFPGLAEVFYIQACSHTGSPIAISRITSKFILHSEYAKQPVDLDLETVGDYVGKCFVRADTLRPGHDSYMVVALHGGGGSPNYFEGFTELDRLFRSVVMQQLKIGVNQQLLQDRIVALLHHVLVGWQSGSLSIPATLRKECHFKDSEQQAEERREEKLAQAEVEDVRQETQRSMEESRGAREYDRLLQEAYPHTDLRELKRMGYKIP